MCGCTDFHNLTADHGFGLALLAVYSHCVGGKSVDDDGACTLEVRYDVFMRGWGEHHSEVVDVSDILASRASGTGIGNETTASADDVETDVGIVQPAVDISQDPGKQVVEHDVPEGIARLRSPSRLRDLLHVLHGEP